MAFIKKKQLPLSRRLEDAVVGLLSASSGLKGLPIVPAMKDGKITSPNIVVMAERTGEAVAQSGIALMRVTITLRTTLAKTTDDGLVALDAAIEEILWSKDPKILAASITSGAGDMHCYAVIDPSSSPEFSEQQRHITYTFTAHCIGRNNQT